MNPVLLDALEAPKELSDGTVDPNTRPFDAVLPKPFKLDELERCLRELTARPAS